MNIDIDLDDYISEDEKKEIATRVFANSVANSISRDPERVFANMSYYIIFEMIDKELNCNSKELIKEKTVKIIDRLSEFAVFRNDSFASNEKKSIAQKYLDEAVENSKELIYDKVLSIVNEKLSELCEEGKEYKITQIIEDVIGRVFYDKLVAKE